jgi:mono/diheme cytochrome c family protein
MRHLIFAFTAAGLISAAGCTKAEEVPVAVAVEPEAAAPAVSAQPTEPAPPVIDAQALGIPTDADSIADGREIAMHQCANCHGLDAEENLRADAPPLRYVLSIYPPESLAENFRAGIHVGHADMPDFVFGDLGMDVLLSYLVSIQETPPAPE